LTIPPSRVVGGSGTLEGDVTNQGTLSPGNSPGEIDIVGSYTQSPTALLNIELAGTTQDLYDFVSISGTATLDGNLAVSLLDGFLPVHSDSFKFLSAGSVIGQFDNAPAT